VGYQACHDDLEHVAFVFGDVRSRVGRIPVYIHRESVISDVFRGPAIDGEGTIAAMMQRVAAAGGGVVLYLRSAEASATGLIGTLQRMFAIEQGVQALSPEANGPDTSILAQQILADLGVGTVQLLGATRTQHAELAELGLQISSEGKVG
jgi:3,4-dihydroxy 2-butanone 4-phosphate synthase/GTP cyclohydrolase II